jgi:hypothetical protein
VARPDLLTTREAAEALACTPEDVRQYASRGWTTLDGAVRKLTRYARTGPRWSVAELVELWQHRAAVDGLADSRSACHTGFG